MSKEQKLGSELANEIKVWLDEYASIKNLNYQHVTDDFKNNVNNYSFTNDIKTFLINKNATIQQKQNRIISIDILKCVKNIDILNKANSINYGLVFDCMLNEI